MTTIKKSKIAVLGAGAFGTALAKVLAEVHDISIWTRDERVAQSLTKNHQHPTRLTGIFFPSNVRASTNLPEVLANSSLVISALPLISLREVWIQARNYIEARAYIMSVTKGIEDKSLALPAHILRSLLGSQAIERLAFLSGPNFAQELAMGLPTAATIAAEHEEVALHVQRMISVESFRSYVSTDVLGVEVGGAIKNVIAIAAGIVHGLNLGQNAQAALITRGIAEMTRLAVAMGAKPATLAGLSGLGDLVLTCSSGMSRNFRFGVALAQGKDFSTALKDIKQTVEGVNTAKSARLLSNKYNVEMPICESVHRILFNGSPPEQVVYGLMTTKLKYELS